MNKFLVTGGAGFIGSNITRYLVKQGCFVRVVDNLLTGNLENISDVMDKIDFIQADMGDSQVAAKAMKDIEVVLHQGALPSVPRSVQDPAATHKHCVDATFTLLLAARNAKIKRFVFAASSSAYGDTPTSPKIETMKPCPLSPYAAAKLVGEYYCSVFYNVYGLETVSLRYFNVFGPYQDPKSQYAAAIPAFVTAILNDESPTIYGDGEQSRDFTYIDNVVQANILAAKAKKTTGQVLNIACGKAVTVNDICDMINKILKKNIKPVHTDTRAGDVRHSLADVTLAEEVIGYKPVVEFRQGLEKAIDWYRQNLL